jgi:hypothetical protein
MQNNRTKLTSEQFDRFEIYYPANAVIVRMDSSKDLLTKSGIKINFNEDTLYSNEDGTDTSSHVADVAAITGTIEKQIDRLYFNRKDVMKTMSWETTVETQIGDVVWFHPLISKNCDEIDVEGVLYKVIPYDDLFVAKRRRWLNKFDGHKTTDIIPLNGNVILATLQIPSLSDLDLIDKDIDTTRGIVKWNGSNNTAYQTKGVGDIVGLKEGDLVVIEKNCYPFFLERSKWNATFDNGNQYFVIQKRHIQAVL